MILITIFVMSLSYGILGLKYSELWNVVSIASDEIRDKDLVSIGDLNHSKIMLTDNGTAINWRSALPELKADGVGVIPLSKEIYEVLRKFRWELKPIHKTLEMNV